MTLLDYLSTAHNKGTKLKEMIAQVVSNALNEIKFDSPEIIRKFAY